MGVRIVAVFPSLLEGHVARGALRAAGLEAELFDHNFGSVAWMDQVAIGGFRLAVPEQELGSARALLESIDRAPFRRRRDPRERGVGWRLLAAGVGLGLAPEFGWLVVALRRRRRSLAVDLVGGTLSCALLLAVGAGLGVIGGLFYALSHPP